ncbi:spore coat protein [Crassaminicella indica]|uniref:Spore coat protein n=2 Tax=Crassaminicella indica TaxID=2855394 RepID=A0ABX8RBZ3_9CLOT|nr:spore coat protein [Crassaminicella indica]QXM05435.1 spore coat protein [Crassaminicella indica]
MFLNQKERLLLQDQKSHEEACIQKYQEFANRAQDPQLKQLFSTYASKEQEHLNTINQILSGQIPALPQQGQQQQNLFNQGQGSTYNENDAKLCQDALMTEKYVSSTYNTTIFECTNTNVRQILNHIQKEEQEHGEGIFNYMKNTGMYTLQ